MHDEGLGGNRFPRQRQLQVFRSSRIESLAGKLVERLREPSNQSAQEPVTVAVGSRGMERWLRGELANGLGICANVRFPFPAQVLAELMDEVLGVDAEATDPWNPDTMAWAVLAALPEAIPDLRFAQVRAYLADEGAVVKRREWALVREIADVLDRYAVFRTDWVRQWSSGTTLPPDLVGDAATEWQAELWRVLCVRLGRPPFADRVARLRDIVTTGQPSNSPRRAVHIFGVSALPPAYIEVLDLVSRVADVSLYVPCPSALFWGDFKTRAERRPGLRKEAREDVLAALQDEHAQQNPILTALGRVARDFQLVLEDAARGYAEPCEDSLFHSLLSPSTILENLQEDVRSLTSPRSLAASGRLAHRVISPSDDSFRVHACHGPTRQVEVLREVLLHMFEDDHALEPRDVVVMTPDIATYAPLVEAVFGHGRSDRAVENGSRQTGENAWGTAGAPSIPVEISDLGLRRINPVADALLRILELGESRLTATAVLDLIACLPVAKRFGISEDDLAKIRTWVMQSGIRWAMDKGDRARADQPSLDANTWRFGLRRLAVGVVVPDEGRLFEEISPFDIEGDDVELYGRFSDACEQLFRIIDDLRSSRTIAEWLKTSRAILEAMTATSAAAGWLTEQVLDELDAIDQAAEAGGCERAVDLGSLRHLLDGRFELPQSSGAVPAGAVTLCALSPMRNVPFKVVCLLGMDDGQFPRASSGRGFDLTEAHPRIGDHQARDEDRMLLLEALLAARSRFHVFYTGRDVRTNEVRPAAVPIGELIDVVVASFPPPEGCKTARDFVFLEHALQPFHAAAFQPKPGSPRAQEREHPFAFDSAMCGAARQIARGAGALASVFVGEPLPEQPTDSLKLEELVAFLRKPVKVLFNRRLQVRLEERSEALEDREPTELHALTSWNMESEMLALSMASEDDDAAMLQVAGLFAARGVLPLGHQQRLSSQAAEQKVRSVLDGVRGMSFGPRKDHSIDLLLPSNKRILGQVRCFEQDGVIFDLESSRATSSRRLLQAWVHLLALSAQEPGLWKSARLIGVERVRGSVVPQDVALRAPEDSLSVLSGLAELYDIGLTRPLRIGEKTTYAYADVLAKNGDWNDAVAEGRAVEAARKAWEPTDSEDGPVPEGADPYLAAAFPQCPPYEGEPGQQVHPEFNRLARLLWQPLLSRLEVTK